MQQSEPLQILRVFNTIRRANPLLLTKKFLLKAPDNPNGLNLLAAAAALAILAFDLLVPLRVAGGVPYVGLVLIGGWHSRRRIFLYAWIGTALTVLGYFLSPSGGISWVVAANRALAIGAVWITATLLSSLTRAEGDRDELRRERTLLEVTGRIARAAGSELEPEELFKTIATEIREAVPCERCALGSVDIESRLHHYWHVESDVEVPPFSDTAQKGLEWFRREVYETKEARNIPDLKGDRIPWADHLVEAGFRSSLVVPILRDGRTIAHISLHSTRAGAFTEDHEALLISVASHLGSALRNAALYKESEERGMSLGMLVDVARRLTSGLNLDDVLDSIVEESAKIFGGESVFRLRDGNDLVLSSRSKLLLDMPLKERVPIDESGTGVAAAKMAPVVFADAENDDRIYLLHRESMKEIGLGASMIVPLIYNNELLGIFTVWREKDRPFEEKSIRVGVSLADQAAVAIENAENHSRLQETLDELRRSQEMIIRQEKLSSLGTLAAGAAHEILNPAGVIQLRAELIAEDVPPGSQERASAGIIVNNVRRIKEICDDLRRFSRDEVPAAEPFNPDDALMSGFMLIKHEFPPSGIQVKQSQCASHPAVMGDANQMQQVFLNLLSNARDAMPKGGTLSISSKEIESGGKLFWEATVSDTGAGIPKEVLPRIFDPFFTTKEPDKGTGLGLSILHGIVKDHGGDVFAETEMEKGTTFTVRLPILPGEENSQVTSKE